MIEFKQLQSFVDAVYNILGLYKPLDIQFRFCQDSEFDAEYWPKFKDSGKIKRHIIRIYITDDLNFNRNFQTLIAHELIHAWQAENDISDIHGQLFQEWADKLEKDFGPIMIQRIYDRELDI